MIGTADLSKITTNLEKDLQITENTNNHSNPELTYIFPNTYTRDDINQKSKQIHERGHARSISHGGPSCPSSSGRPIKSAIKGHQRAFSHGEINDNQIPPKSGHSRVGSKTDFILPPGHKDESETREISTSASFSGRGHSRQASRSESIYTLRRMEKPPWWKRFLFCNNSKFDERGYRIVVPNHTVPSKTPKAAHPNRHFVINKIRTTKYTLLSFIPKNLLEQFHRVANLYFIFIVLLNWFPAINAFGKEVAMIPVLFVLGVTAIKDLFEDRRRLASDKRINNSTCRVYHGEQERYKKALWEQIRVGDLVHLSNDEIVPADILLLRTSDLHGACYIDTCDLDGESNLKRREVVRGFTKKQNIFSPNKFVSKIETDMPSTKIYKFNGAIIHPSGERIPITTENLLLRESKIKNTDFIEGIVIYAGHETKAMMNNSGPRYKRSHLEQQMNLDVIWCVIILLILCTIGAIGCNMWLSSFEGVQVPYLPFEINAGYESFLTFWTYIIILQVLIPLSLYVTIELCKILQVYYIHNNNDLFDAQTNKRTECRAMNIAEELGQVQHIFSDKTGTLTENKMIFRRCTINGIDYNHAFELENECSNDKTKKPLLVKNPKLINILSTITENPFSYEAKRIQDFFIVLAICNTVVASNTPHHDVMNASGIIEFNKQENTPMLIESLKSFSPNKKNIQAINSVSRTTLNSSATDRYKRLTDTITPTTPSSLAIPKSSHHIPSLSPISSSPESTPVSGSPPMKTKFSLKNSSSTIPMKHILSTKINNVPNFLTTKSQQKYMTKQSLQTSFISSNRPIYEAESPDELALVNAACSYDFSLINRSPNHIIMNIPGKGQIEYEVLKILPFDSSRKCMSIVLRQTESQEIILYTKGADSSIMPSLRPCSSDSIERNVREKTQQNLDNYAREGLRVLVMAKRILNAREYNDWWTRHQEIEISLENKEKRLRESFEKLETNLLLLGVTGIEDRLQEGVPETIVTLLLAGISIWVLTGDKPETAINVAYSANLFLPEMEILRLTARSRNTAEAAILFYLSEIEAVGADENVVRRRSSKLRALVIDGKTLTFILDLRSNLVPKFLRLCRYCASVLCCRSTPLQKAYLVKVVKEQMRVVTLAIGDGANDVSMIQMADVGVGISGQEGMQAVMAADFTVAKFKYLKTLLLSHGYWCYDRLARMILFFFYKNAAFVYLVFWYQLYCGFSGAVMIDQMYLMLYNLFFTSLPPLAIGVYDKRVPEDLLLSNPFLYKHGRLGRAYKTHSFWIIMLEALYESIVIFFVAEAAYKESDVGIWEFGTTVTTSCLFTMIAYGAIEIRSWTALHFLSIICSILAFYIFAISYNLMCVTCFGLPSTYWVIIKCITSPVYWLVIFLTMVIGILPRLTFYVLKTSLYPDETTRLLLQYKKLHQREPQIKGVSIRL